MKSWKVAAALMIAVGSVVGCDKSDDKAAAPTVTTPAGGASGMMDKMHEAETATKDKATEMKNSAVSSATDAQATLVAEAQKYYDQAKSYIDSKNFAGASDMVSKLESLKSQLPAEWAAKIDELSSMLTKAKASLGSMIPAAK